MSKLISAVGAASQGSAWRAWQNYVQQRACKAAAAGRALQHWRAPCLQAAMEAWRWFLSVRRDNRAVCAAVVGRMQHRQQVWMLSYTIRFRSHEEKDADLSDRAGVSAWTLSKLQQQAYWPIIRWLRDTQLCFTFIGYRLARAKLPQSALV